MPSLRTNSVTLSARQDLSSGVSVFADGLYVARDANSVNSDPSFYPAPAINPTTLRKYGRDHRIQLQFGARLEGNCFCRLGTRTDHERLLLSNDPNHTRECSSAVPSRQKQLPSSLAPN